MSSHQPHTTSIGDTALVHFPGYPGRYQVLDRRGHAPSAEVHLKNLADPSDIFWIYEAHCHIPTELKLKNARARRQAREQAAQAILDRPRRKH